MTRRLVSTVLLASLASCFAPETARFYGGYWAVSDIDNSKCRARAGIELVTPAGDAPLAQLAPEPTPSSPSSSPPSRPVTPPPPPPPPPSAGATYRTDVAGIGAFDVAVHLRGTIDVEGVFVAPEARIGIGLTPPELRARPVPGFVFGVDLRPYQHIVVVVDNTADMCESTTPGGSRVILDDVIDQVLASLSGLPLDRQVSLVAASGKVRQLVPVDGAAGRRLALEWTCGLLCEGDSSMTLGLVRAFDEHPDVVVLLSNGAMPPAEHNGSVTTLPDLASIAADPAEALARMEYTAPVISIDVGHGANRDRLHRIAEVTGGAYVVP